MSHAGGYPASLKALTEYAPVRSWQVRCGCDVCQKAHEANERDGVVRRDVAEDWEENLDCTAMMARAAFLDRGWAHDTEGRWFAPGHRETEDAE